MSTVRTSIDIAAPPTQVWEFVMDPTKAEQWVTIHRGLKDHDGGRLRPGYRMDQRLCLRGVNFDVHWQLKEVDPPWYALWEGQGPARSRADRRSPGRQRRRWHALRLRERLSRAVRPPGRDGRAGADGWRAAT